MNVDRDKDTICAVATPFGRGGISVIRISGDRALAIARALCPFMPEDLESHRVYYGLLIEKGSFLEVDEVSAMVAWLVSEENSFTTGAVFDISGGRATY